MQPVEIGLGFSATDSSTLRLEYGYGASTNNGNVLIQKITPSQSAAIITQSYSYNSLNRLTSAQDAISSATRWTQNYGYNRFVNRTSLTNSGSEAGLLPTQSTPAVSTASNRLTGYSYDLAGNATFETCPPELVERGAKFFGIFNSMQERLGSHTLSKSRYVRFADAVSDLLADEHTPPRVYDIVTQAIIDIGNLSGQSAEAFAQQTRAWLPAALEELEQAEEVMRRG